MIDEPENSAARILICEDEVVPAEELPRTLENLGYEVVARVTAAEQAIRAAEDMKPDLIIMDIELVGEIDAIDAAGEIRARMGIPVVYLTGWDQEDLIDRAKRTEPYGYLGKSASVLEVRNTIETALYKHEADKRIRESEERFRLLYENTPLGYQSLDENGYFVEVNKAWLDTLGYSREEVIGKWFGDFLAPEFVDRFKFNFPRFKEMGEIHWVEFDMIKKGGSRISVAFDGQIGRDRWGRFKQTHCILHDVTDRKKLEEQLLQSQKMEAVGTLAGGIAHDVNNVLQVIDGSAEMALFDIVEGQPGYWELKEIRLAARSAAELTQGLLTFSRRVDSKLRPMDLNRELAGLSKMLARTLPKMIEIRMDLDPSLRTVNADPAQLQQVVMNLAVNARDAMPNGGTLSVETKNVHLDEEYCKVHLDADPGDYVLLSVSDSGTGMDEETRKHIFNPFFTTKETGRGTGLGLSIAFGIVKNHGGNMICYSEPGHGTTFKVYLPAFGEMLHGAETVKTTALPGGNETVMVVDDEELVRKLAAQILGKFGYTVLTATNGKEGVRLFSQEQGRIDLVILDLIMPEMGGRDCLREIMRMAPETRVIIASGYAANGQMDHALAEGARAFVRKPYDVRELLEVVRKVLDE